MRNKSITIPQICDTLDISRMTLYPYLAPDSTLRAAANVLTTKETP